MAAPRSESEGPRDRILRTAEALFTRQGYANTGINQILEESGAHKASLYRHFQTKEELALAYLQRQDLIFRQLLDQMMARSKGPRHFAKLWSGLLWRTARSAPYHGCPVSNLRSQLEPEQQVLNQAVAATIAGWTELLEEFLERERKAGRFSGTEKSAAVAARLLRAYQGAMQMFRMTGRLEHIRALEADLQLALGLRPD